MSMILVLERLSSAALSHLRKELDDDVIFSKNIPGDESLAAVSGLVVRSQTHVCGKLLQKMPALKCIVTATSGFDHIDLTAAAKRDITVMYSPDGNAISAAEHTWALLLACSRKLKPAEREATKNTWDRSQLLGSELYGKTIGIIGLGRVGLRVANIAQAFGMNVQYHDVYLNASDQIPEQFECMGLIELLRSSDVISLHVPLTAKTHHLLNHQTLQHLQSRPILINCARGEVICEDALVKHLENDTISAVGLDVFEREPLAADSRLHSFEQVFCTPHVGATTTEAFERVSMIAAEKTIDFFKRGVTSDPLPGRIPWLNGQ